MTDWLKRNSEQAAQYTNAAAGVGAAVAGAGGGPLAVLTGAAAALLPIATDYTARQLSKAQRGRVDRVIVLAAEELKRVVAEEGCRLRSDGFFDEQPDGRHFGREAAEGVLTVARDSYQERRLPFIGHLLVLIALHEYITPEFAHRLIRLSDELSWTQFVLLAAIERRELIQPPDLRIGHSERSWASWSISNELYDLCWERNLVGAPRLESDGIPYPNMQLRDQELTTGGVAVFGHLGLEDVGSLDIERVWRLAVQERDVHDPGDTA